MNDYEYCCHRSLLNENVARSDAYVNAYAEELSRKEKYYCIVWDGDLIARDFLYRASWFEQDIPSRIVMGKERNI